MSWQLPHAPLRRRVLASQGAAAALTLMLAVLVTQAVPTAPTYPLKALLVFAVISVVALGWLEGRHPFDTFGAANRVTTIRAMFVALVAALVGEPRTDTIAALAAAGSVAATALDGVDGWLARRTGISSEFGARYDMEIDALLILILSVLAWQHGQAGWWILPAGLMRYGFIASGYVWSWMNAPLPESVRRKTVCVIQIIGLAVAVSPVVGPPASTGIAALTLVTLVYSFLVDVLWLRRHGA